MLLVHSLTIRIRIFFSDIINSNVHRSGYNLVMSGTHKSMPCSWHFKIKNYTPFMLLCNFISTAKVKLFKAFSPKFSSNKML